MLDFFSNNAIYIVLAIVVTIWLGYGFYIMNIDKKLSILEKKVNENNHEDK